MFRAIGFLVVMGVVLLCVCGVAGSVCETAVDTPEVQQVSKPAATPVASSGDGKRSATTAGLLTSGEFWGGFVGGAITAMAEKQDRIDAVKERRPGAKLVTPMGTVIEYGENGTVKVTKMGEDGVIRVPGRKEAK